MIHIIEGNKNRPIRFEVVEPQKAAETVIVVVHGMQEHSGRYKNFAQTLAEHGIAVVLSDLRGHGSNITNKPGLDDGNIFLNIVEDQLAILKKVRELFKGAKLVVLGHSYGSFVTQRLIKIRADADEFILSGSCYMNTLLVKMGGVVAGLSRVFKGRDAGATLVEKMSIKGYGKRFENGNWLTRDESVWDAYNADPLCGQEFPVAFYQSMFSELPKNYSKLKNSVGYAPRILVMSGDSDPVGNFGKGVRRLARTYENAGFDVTLKLYPGGRHEMLNEINRDEVIEDILNWL